MLETLDPHTTFLKPDQYREMKSDTSGQFSGIGIEVDLRDGVLTVLSVMDGTLAARAGLAERRSAAQDRRSADARHDRLRACAAKGHPGRARRPAQGWLAARSFNITRELIKIRSVEAFLSSRATGW